MSKPVNSTLIGTFFLAAIGLIILSIIMFGGGSYFEKRHQFVLFFHSQSWLINLPLLPYF